ncbi:hypothetical protein COO60DRAFT_1459675 [Scenedesmus sp. NREL 46B-D3]|nr:hypothetical protein COO60DRAFT_1459675 [Scenedesmus sp. NREL 46B-D3]
MNTRQTVDDDNLQKRRPFHVSSRRFAAPGACINACPGPGSYTDDDATCWQYGSLGSKGCGAMCSSSTRLTARLHYSGPGPASYSPQDSTAARPAAHASHTPGRPATAAHSSSTASSIAPPPGTYDCSITHNGEAVTWSAKPGAGAAFKASARQPASQRAPPRQLPALQQQLLQELHTAPAAATRLGYHRQALLSTTQPAASQDLPQERTKSRGSCIICSCCLGFSHWALKWMPYNRPSVVTMLQLLA